MRYPVSLLQFEIKFVMNSMSAFSFSKIIAKFKLESDWNITFLLLKIRVPRMSLSVKNIYFQHSFSFKSMVTKYFRTSLIETIPSVELQFVSDWSHDFVKDSIRLINGGIVIKIWTWDADGHFSNSTRHFSR